MKLLLENITEEELKEIIVDEINAMIEEDSGILSNIFKFCPAGTKCSPESKKTKWWKGVNEKKNPRIPRKKGQPAKSKKHSDLYTDEDPKGTIHGLGYKDEATARASVAKIRKSNRSHAHKTQAAIAMEQRAKAAGKSKEAAIFRKFIEQQKKKTKAKNKKK